MTKFVLSRDGKIFKTKTIKEFIEKRSQQVLSSIKNFVIDHKNDTIKLFYNDPVIFNTVEETWKLEKA